MAGRLLDWYDHSARKLPWRALPGETADPYRVWLSEIMLQQTSVAAVIDYFNRFTTAWPDVHALAAAELDEVLQQWAGLGYYARARNLHACARMVVSEHGGVFPDCEQALRTLPGIGPYTGAAIAAIAFGKKAAAVDGNVERVMTRLYAIETALPDAKPEIHARTLAIVPEMRPGDFAQALMDLGATVCTPKRANCLICPLSAGCAGRARGIADSLPVKRQKPKIPTRHGIAFWVQREDGAVLLRRRPEKGLLGGMLEVPSTCWSEAGPGDAAAEAPVTAQWQNLDKAIEHTFTHFHLKLAIWRARPDFALTDRRGNENRWLGRDELADAALPTVMKKVVAVVLGSDAVRRRR